MDDIFERLRRDHYLHRMLVRRLVAAADARERAQRIAGLARHLLQHTEAERPLIEVALHEGDEARRVAMRALRGQMLLSRRVAALGGALHEAPLFAALARDYRAQMEAQLRLEEELLFPIAARAAGDAAA